ncbi:PilW family protein [Photobacterium aphoticum]|uniref:PilW family protein n=1 Tax=Photobacterium aphoticum TaxID=754436 RepID=UPI00069E20B4|nr:hypothetical protein [Photobacterium aphoticum]PSU47094.1 hypothetical protein C9I90_23100 [Photobacterium aphoticum]
MKDVAKHFTRQRGASLVELLIASSVGLVVLASVTGVFITGQNLASERMKQLMLAQDVNDAIRLIKSDVQRAGYNAEGTGSLVLSGAVSTLNVPASNDAISYIYEDENSEWRIVKFRLSASQPQTLQMCVDTVSKGLATMPADATCGSGTVSTLLDTSHFTLSNFTVTPTVLATSSANSTLLNISLSASLNQSQYSKTVSATLKARNWN